MLVQNLIYNEDNEAKIFTSDKFNFIFDKTTFSSFSWGETKKITPIFNPISPEEINLILSDAFVFDNLMFLKLFNLNIHKETIEKSNFTSVSCISSINVTSSNYYNNDNIKQLFNYLNYLNFVSFLEINYSKQLTLKDIFKLKYINVKNVMLVVNKFSINLIESIKLLIENDIYVKVKFITNNENFENFYNIISNEEYPKQLLTLINFNKSFKKNNLMKLTSYLKKNNLLNIVIERNYFNYNKKYEMKSIYYRPCIDSCVIDLINNKIYPSLEKNEIFVNINDINNIYDYWNSNVFLKFRKSIVSKIEKEKLKNEEPNIKQNKE